MLDALLLASTALAQAADAAAPKGPSGLEMLILPAGFLLIMYFFMIRPQQAKQKQHTELLNGLKAGDEVVTNGGIIGKVRSVQETFVTLEVSNNTSIKVLKNAIAGPVKAQAAAAAVSAKEQPAKS